LGWTLAQAKNITAELILVESHNIHLARPAPRRQPLPRHFCALHATYLITCSEAGEIRRLSPSEHPSTGPTAEMSALPAEVHTALAQLLGGLQSGDNAIRTQAEEALNTEWVAQRPDVLLMGLAEQIEGSIDDGVS
jgi:hypothetical protein